MFWKAAKAGREGEIEGDLWGGHSAVTSVTSRLGTRIHGSDDAVQMIPRRSASITAPARELTPSLR